MASLRFLNGPRQNQIIQIRDGDVCGRDDQTEVQILAPGISRRHCQFVQESGSFFLCDMGSMNHTYVNKKPITRVPLRHGDTISVGGIHFRFVDDGAFMTSMTDADGEDEEEPQYDDVVDASMMVSNALLPSFQQAEADVVGALQRRLKLFYELSQDLGSVQNTNELLTRVMAKLFEAFEQVERGLIMVGDELEDLEVKVVRFRSESEERLPVSRNITRKVYVQRQAILCKDFMAEPDSEISGEISARTLTQFSHRSFIAAPMIFQSDCFGYILLDAKGRGRFDREDLDLLAGIASQSSVFLKNDRLFKLTSLERYFSQDLARQIINGRIDLRPGGDLKSGTVFFSDLIGFTSMSERQTPHEVITLMNRYFEKMVNIILKHRGYIDKFIGDAIMAVWGAPAPVEDEVQRAMTAALEMQNALYLLNRELDAEGVTNLRMAIGLNSGRFIAGNLGSDRRMEYTVLGDAVNLAQRVESLAGCGNLFISEATYERAERKVLACRLRPAMVKGKRAEVTIYSVRGIPSPGDPGLFIMSMPFFVPISGELCEGLLVKAKLQGGHILAQILVPRAADQPSLELTFVPQEAPSFVTEFIVQREVALKERYGVCLNGALNASGTMLEELLRDGDYVSPRAPHEMPRKEPHQIWSL